MSSMRPEFIDYIRSILPEHLSLDEFTNACQRPLRKSIRVNTLKISAADFQLRMAPYGWSFEPIPWCASGFWLERTDTSIPLGKTVEHLAGLFYIQEASSMLPPMALFANGEVFSTVLDMASAPGSKTTQIAALMNNEGCLVANEYSASRIKSLHANVQRLGVKNVALTHFDAHVFGHYCEESFDAILLDAPCGGEGTIRKDETALDDWSMAHIESMVQIQTKLMKSAFRALKVGGHLIYSTCTLNHHENQEVCYALKEAFGDAVVFESLVTLFDGAEDTVTPEGFLHVWPQVYDSEGFFVARVRKERSVPSAEDPVRKIRPSGFAAASKKMQQEVDTHFEKSFGCRASEYGHMMVRENELWLYPASFSQVTGKVRFDRVGIRLADIHKKGYRTHYDAVIALPVAQEKMVHLTKEQAEVYLMGRDVALENFSQKGEVCVAFDGYALGLGKALGSKIKNNLPRYLIKEKMFIP